MPGCTGLDAAQALAEQTEDAALQAQFAPLAKINTPVSELLKRLPTQYVSGRQLQRNQHTKATFD